MLHRPLPALPTIISRAWTSVLAGRSRREDVPCPLCPHPPRACAVSTRVTPPSSPPSGTRSAVVGYFTVSVARFPHRLLRGSFAPYDVDHILRRCALPIYPFLYLVAVHFMLNRRSVSCDDLFEKEVFLILQIAICNI